jgi:L-ascorbate metabolism protein UlaG (beta-lactamase superfamily)
MDAKELVEKLRGLGHDSCRLDGPPSIYLDPWKQVSPLTEADLVLVSHDHYDHCSPDDVALVVGPKTVILAEAAAAAKLPGARVMVPGDRVEVAGVTVEAVPAYNVNKFRSPGVPFHPKGARYLGFVVTVASAPSISPATRT